MMRRRAKSTLSWSVIPARLSNFYTERGGQLNKYSLVAQHFVMTTKSTWPIPVIKQKIQIYFCTCRVQIPIVSSPSPRSRANLPVARGCSQSWEALYRILQLYAALARKPRTATDTSCLKVVLTAAQVNPTNTYNSSQLRRTVHRSKYSQGVQD
jgi:hypothetical protein